MLRMLRSGPRPTFFVCKGLTAGMDPAEKVKAIVEPTVEAMGYELVRVSYGGGTRPKLQIMAERPDGTMGVDDCAALSQELSALLDVEDPIASEYVLEVSSPGVDRPLTRPKDFDRWAGFEAKVELESPVDGRRRFKGRLLGREDDRVKMTVDGQDVVLPLDRVAKAKLVMTDELLSAAARAARPS